MLCCWLSVLLAIGCGSQTGPERIAVYGTVTRHGKSVEQGSISFLPSPGHAAPAANELISGGEYRFTTENGPTAGPHRVVVHTAPKKTNLAKANDSAPNVILIDPAKKKATNRQQWEFEITVSEQGCEQNFKLE